MLVDIFLSLFFLWFLLLTLFFFSFRFRIIVITSLVSVFLSNKIFVRRLGLSAS